MMDVSSVGNKLRRSIHLGEEVHSRGRPTDRQYGLQILPSAHISIRSWGPIIRLGIIKLFSLESSGPRQREGITVRTHLRDDLQQRPR